MKLLERVLGSFTHKMVNIDDMQFGFVPGKGTTDAIFIFRQLQEKYFATNKVSKGAKIRNRYNQEPHLTKDTNGKVTNTQLDTTNESQEASPFPAGDNKAHTNRCAQRLSKHKTKKHKRSTKEVPP